MRVVAGVGLVAALGCGGSEAGTFSDGGGGGATSASSTTSSGGSQAGGTGGQGGDGGDASSGAGGGGMGGGAQGGTGGMPCFPKTCDKMPRACGPTDDGCGGLVTCPEDCGDPTGYMKCEAGVCACTKVIVDMEPDPYCGFNGNPAGCGCGEVPPFAYSCDGPHNPNIPANCTFSGNPDGAGGAPAYDLWCCAP